MTAKLSRRSFLRGVGTMAAATALAGRLPATTVSRAASRPSNGLRFGVQTAPQQVSYDDIRRVWGEADELEFDTAFVFDHLMPIPFSFRPVPHDPDGRCFEGWTLLAALAAQTERVRVGVLVTGNTYRHPAVLAKMAATVDHVSHGRLILGMGAGWFELEHTAYGIPFYTPGERARRVVEAVQVVKQLFTQQRSTLAGKYYQLEDAPFEPKGIQRPYPPILIGGMGPKVMQPLAAREADIWHFFMRGNQPEAARRINDNFDAICRRVGRDPTEVERAIFIRPPSGGAGEAKAQREQVQALADAGVQHFIVSLRAPYDREGLRTFAKEVMPAFR